MKFKGIIRYVEIKDLPAIREIYTPYYPDQLDLDYFVGKVKKFIDKTPGSLETDSKYLVAEISNKAIGLLGFRKPLKKLLVFTKTSKPVELSSLFISSQCQNSGAGRALIEKMREIVGIFGYTEVVVHSDEKFKDSWAFYDKMGFERAGKIVRQDGAGGQVWRQELN